MNAIETSKLLLIVNSILIVIHKTRVTGSLTVFMNE